MASRALESALSGYVRARFGAGVEILAAEKIGGGELAGKGFGYGDVLRLRLAGAPWSDVVIHTTRRGGFGHDTLADRAAAALEPWTTFGNLPAHVRAVDVGTIDGDGALRSLGDVRDFFLVTAWGPGEPFARDLDRIAKEGAATEEDEARVERLAEHLAKIHRDKHDAPELWARRLRELVGHHECIAGLVDSYDGHAEPGVPTPETLRAIEHWSLDWRHRLKPFASRLCRVHGDFHPWNVLFEGQGYARRMTLLDRSRGEWGEAADDLAAMAINFLFFSWRAGHPADGPFAALYRRFFETYLRATGDLEVLRVIPPFLAWRALVVASPVWYPHLDGDVRARIFRFVDDLRRDERIDLSKTAEHFAR
jgi:hypothetical protein